MLRKLPLTITADETPDWLPIGWVVHSTGLSRGRQTRTYTHLRTGKKLFTKDQVLEYIKMDKIREDREAAIQRKKLRAFQDNEAARERPSWLPDDREAELGIGSYCINPFYTMYDSGFKPHSEQEALQCHNTKESEAASSGKLEVARERPLRLPDDSKAEPGTGSYGGTPYTINENTSSGFNQNIKESEAASSGKIEETGSDYITYDYNTDEEDWSDNEYVEEKGSRENVNIIPTPLRLQPERMKKLESRAITQCLLDDEGMSSENEENIHEVETTKEENELEEANLHDVGVDEAREIPGLTGSLSIEINLNCEPASDSLLDKSGTEDMGTRNVGIRYQESDLVPISASPKVVELTRESRDKNEEPLKTQATQGENSNARSSADDLINPCLDTPQEKNIIGSKKRKKSAEPCSSKNIKKKDTEARPDKFRKGKKTPRKRHVNIEEEPVVEWPEPDPTFPFEPIRIFEYDDSIIQKYLEEYYAGAGSDRSNLPLPDFGLPSFSNIQISRDEEPECNKKEKSPDPTTCVKIASSSLPCC